MYVQLVKRHDINCDTNIKMKSMFHWKLYILYKYRKNNTTIKKKNEEQMRTNEMNKTSCKCIVCGCHDTFSIHDVLS